ncbi:hypothetical protein ACVIJ6_004428 [Bradyrhizobium sp. USDA 4369]
MTKGSYAGGVFGFRRMKGLGGGLYIDSHGRLYPQLYSGEPGFGISGGYTDDLEGLLTGPSISGSFGRGPVRLNGGWSGSASGFGIGTPGVGVTNGYGPFDMSKDFSRPWTKAIVRDSAARAGVPSRQNVWEYGFPDPPDRTAAERNGRSGPTATGGASDRFEEASAFGAGRAPVPFANVGGLTGPAANNSERRAGGLLGLIQDYLRSRGDRAGW